VLRILGYKYKNKKIYIISFKIYVVTLKRWDVIICIVYYHPSANLNAQTFMYNSNNDLKLDREREWNNVLSFRVNDAQATIWLLKCWKSEWWCMDF